MPDPTHNYAIVLAGGSGTRFWPVSRQATPKQLSSLVGDGTLLAQTIDRLDGLVPADHILVLTNAAQLDAVRAALPGFPTDNILAEPAKRDTGPAIALAIGWVAARDPQATMAVLPSDHLIPDTAAYQHTLSAAFGLATSTSALVTLGITPSWPCPSYGYIERAERFQDPSLPNDIAAYDVAAFREKPDPETATKFLAAGNFAWNAGMFLWSVPAVLAELDTHAPELANFAREISTTADTTATIAEKFPALTPLSIDYALMEKASRVLNVDANFGWDDLGSWLSLAGYLDQTSCKNASNTTLSTIDAKGNIVFSSDGRHVALLGVSDLVVVQTPDSVLVVHKSQAEQIKKLVDILPKELI
ncbi:MAG: sugar phosphate nucleotidyltransferase [Verrucomicrobiales bacterium]|nr:sugar phosphate nucleotidyltransferase [Verrucomicrobiales bacterium]